MGIELDNIRVEVGKEFSVSGTAFGYQERSPNEVVALMQETLRQHGLFDDLSVSWANTGNMGRFKFDLTGKVKRPYLDPKYDEENDFSVKTHAIRLYGRDKMASAKEPSLVEGGADTGVEELSPDSQPDEDALASGETDEGRGPRSRSAPPRAGLPIDSNVAMPGEGDAEARQPGEIPAELTEAQIEAMSAAELNDALLKIARARTRHKGDAALDARLKKEQEQVLAQLKKVRGT
jgi:hypothetical protein